MMFPHYYHLKLIMYSKYMYTFPRRLHSWGRVNCGSKEAISWHFRSNNSGNHFTYFFARFNSIHCWVLVTMCLCIVPWLIFYAEYIMIPVCTPARMVMVLGAISGRTTLPHAAFRSSAILHISSACLQFKPHVCCIFNGIHNYFTSTL